MSPNMESPSSKTGPAPQSATTDAASSKNEPAPAARLNVFGEPRIEDVTAPGQPLRSKARELAVFLACHPDGADTRTIGDHLEPDVRLRFADTRVHTNVSNLRHALGRAAGARKSGYITKRDGRYRIDRTHVEVDLWKFQELIAQAVTAPLEQRIALLREACNLYAGPLAQGCDYDWVEAHRERARQHASEAHLVLAETLVSEDLQGASDVLDQAIRLDRYNEELYRKAMEVRHRIGDDEGIRNLLRALTAAMSDLDAEPDETTRQLAHNLRGKPVTRAPAG